VTGSQLSASIGPRRIGTGDGKLVAPPLAAGGWRLAAIGSAAVGLAFAVLACATTSAPTVVGNVVEVTPLNLPPVWTPTWNGLPSPVPGWAAIPGNGIELSLPTSYDGGDAVALAQELADQIATLPEYADLAEAVRQNPEGYRLLAIDRQTGSIIAVTLKDVPSSMPMSDYVDGWTKAVLQLSPGSAVIDQGLVQFRDAEAGRVIVEFNVQGSSSWQLCYIVRQGEQIWTFNFGAAKEDFYQLQPIFEQSLQTLRFLP